MEQLHRLLSRTAASTLALAEELQGLMQRLQSCRPPGSTAPAEDEACPWPEAFCGEVGCLVHDRLLPTFCDLQALATRSQGAGQGQRPDFERLWARLRPDVPPTQGIAGLSGEEAPCLDPP